jgi:hypothetical protein
MKKRELLPQLNDAITALAAISGDVAKLEVHDNDQASRRVKGALAAFEKGPYLDLKTSILDLRKKINSK